MHTADVRAWLASPRSDVWIAATLAGAAAMETVIFDAHLSGSRAITAVAAVAICATVAERRRRPAIAVGSSIAILLLQAVVGGAAWDESFATLVAQLLVAYGVAARSTVRVGAIAGAAIISANTVCALVRGDADKVFDIVVVIIVFSAALLAGMASGAHRSQASELRVMARQVAMDTERQAAEAVSDERRRIANELHDIVAHGVSLIAVQAAAGQRVLARPAAPVVEGLQILANIERAAQDALDDMRRLLGILRADDHSRAPLPRACDLPAVAASAAASGIDIDLTLGDALDDLPPAVDVAVYRIAQEAITNIVKHGSAPATVRVRKSERAVEVEAENATAPGRSRLRSGHYGLIGMKERVEIYGGTMTTDDDGASFRLVVTLPVARAER